MSREEDGTSCGQGVGPVGVVLSREAYGDPYPA